MISTTNNRFRRAFRATTIGVLLTFWDSAALCQTGDTLKTIEKLWKARQERIRSARVSWVERHTVTKGFVTDLLGAMPGGAQRLTQMGITPGSIVPPQDVSFDITASFTFKGARARLDYDDRQWSATEKAFVPQPEVTVYDGKVSKRLLVKGTPYSAWPYGHVTGAHPFRGSLILIPLIVTLCPMHPDMRLFDINALVATGQRAVIRGRLCLELQQVHRNVVERLWLDPSRDFIMLRFLRTINERTLNKIDVHYHQDSNGQWLPERWE